MWSPRALVVVGFVMLLLTSLQGWGMVGIIAATGELQSELMLESKRLHNLGLSGGFLAIAFGLAMTALPLKASHATRICKLLLPSLLIAPLAFCDRMLVIQLGSIPEAVQGVFFALQAVSALGITVSLVLIVVWLLRDR